MLSSSLLGLRATGVALRSVARARSSAHRAFSRTSVALQQDEGEGAASSGVNFYLSPSQVSIMELGRQFTKDEIIPASAGLDKSGAFPQEIFRKAWELGLVNVHIPAEYGGQGLSNLDGILIAEELSYGDAGVMTGVEINSVAAMPLLLAGSDALKKEYFGRLLAEPIQAAYAVTEPDAGSDVAGIKTKAEKKGDNEWVINGNKMWISNGGVANWYFVLARTGPAGAPPGQAFTGFIVDRDTKGFTVGPKEDMLGQRCSSTCGLTFEDVVVSSANVVGEVGKGFQLAMKVFDYTRPPVAAGAVGIARRALDESIRYSTTRKAFGAPLASQQAIQFKIADMAAGIEAARLLTYQASAKLDAGTPSGSLAAQAKLFASEHAQRCVSECVQIHGGIGFHNACIASKLYRDARIATIYEGTSEIQRLIISRALLSQFASGTSPTA